VGKYVLDARLPWKFARSNEGHEIFTRQEFGGVWVAAVAGFRGGEHKTSGPRARERAIEQAVLRTESMNNVE
jgi:hypothetical protein